MSAEPTDCPPPPARSAQAVRLVRATLGAVWLYQGLVPKLLFPNTGELAMSRSVGFSVSAAHWVALVAGSGEILVGLLFWLLPGRWLRLMCWLHLLAMLGLGAAALAGQPALLVASFNPLTLNAALAALAGVALLLTTREGRELNAAPGR